MVDIHGQFLPKDFFTFFIFDSESRNLGIFEFFFFDFSNFEKSIFRFSKWFEYEPVQTGLFDLRSVELWSLAYIYIYGFQIQQLEKLSRTQGAYGMTIFTLMGV